MGMFARISMPSSRSAAALSVRTIPETVSENRSHAPSDDELLAGVTSTRVFTGVRRAAKSSDTMWIACSPSVRTFTSVPAKPASVNRRMSDCIAATSDFPFTSTTTACLYPTPTTKASKMVAMVSLAVSRAQKAVVELHLRRTWHGDTRGMCRIFFTPYNAVTAPWSERKVRCLVHSSFLLRRFVHRSVRDTWPRNLRVMLVVALFWFRVVTTFCFCFCISCSSYVCADVLSSNLSIEANYGPDVRLLLHPDPGVVAAPSPCFPSVPLVDTDPGVLAAPSPCLLPWSGTYGSVHGPVVFTAPPPCF